MRLSADNTLSRSRGTDRLIDLWARLCAIGSGAVVLFIIASVVVESLPALGEVGLLRFVTDASWHPVEGEFGLMPMVFGSLAATLIALAIAAPVGLLSAVFCRFYAPVPVAGAYRKLLEMLAGIPSVVYGVWGLTVLVPLISRFQPPGTSLLAGSLIISLMIIPTVALLSEAAIMNVPRSYTDAAAALGLSRWATLRQVVLPASRSALITAMLLGTGRAIGETMAVLMVCGNVVKMPTSVFDPIRTLTSNIALEMAYAMDVHRAALFVSGLALAAVVTVIVLLADRAESRVR